MQVLITRAKDQSQSFENMCYELGLEPILLPSVQIRVDTKNNSFIHSLRQLDKTDLLIVVSANAAKIAVPHWPSCTRQKVTLAIGQATAKAIQNLDRTVDFVAEPANSEGLLSLPALASDSIQNKKIIIFCGHNPKPLLKKILEQRGAHVHLAFCYERICPIPLTEQAWQTRINPMLPLVTISTSSELLHNLVFITPTRCLKLLTSHPLIVISDEMVSLAKQLGFALIIQAKNAGLEAIKEALEHYVASR
jgi:uroporphyrinogen-III synthase